MKRVGNLFDTFCSFQHLHASWQKAHRGTRKNQESAHFFQNLENELLALRAELQAGTWSPQPYRFFEIYDPKERTISVATFRDRVVHHALVGVLEPVFERSFIFDSYATRKGKGVHAAVARAQSFLRRERWFLKTDVEKYFDSMSHEVLLGLLERKIKDRLLLAVAEKIIRNGGEAGVGLPIGNLTSQFFANVYLDPFDHFVKDEMGVKGYVRYMDDFVLFASEKESLKKWKPRLETFLAERLGLSLKGSATFLNSAQNGLRFLGRRVFPGMVRLHRENLRRVIQRIKIQERRVENGRLPEAAYFQSVNSRWAYLTTGLQCYGLRMKLLGFGEAQS